MSEDRIGGAVKSRFGQAEETIGGAVGDDELDLKGRANEVIGNVQEAYGKAADSVKDATESFEQMLDEEPYKALGIAVAAGIVVGFLLGRSGRKVVYVRS